MVLVVRIERWNTHTSVLQRMADALHVLWLSRWLMVCLLGRVAVGSPKHQWPLTQRTVLWDNQDDQNSGWLEDSAAQCPYVVELSPFDHGSFFYDGTGSSAAAFPIPEEGTFDKYSFTLWLQPDPSVLSSPHTTTLFHYRSHSQPSGSVTKVSAVLLTGGYLQLTLWKGSAAAPEASLTSSVPLSSSAFRRVLLSADKGKDKVYVTVGDDEDKTSADVAPLAVPGEWQLGGAGDAGQEGRYRGKVTCVSFFDFRVERGAHSSEYRCTDSYSPSGVPSCPMLPEPVVTTTVTTTTTLTTTSLAVTTAVPTSSSAHTPGPWPQYLWPLDNVTRGHDVISGSGPVASPQKLACLRTADDVEEGWGNLTSPPLFMDGSSQSSLHMRVNDSVFSHSFSVAVFIKPGHPCEGQIWSFHSSSSLKIGVRLEANCSVLATVWNVGSGSPCGQVTAPGALNDRGSAFTLVRVQKGAEDLTIHVEDSVWTAEHWCVGCGPDCGESALYVGARFRGSLLCLAIFSQLLPGLAESDYFAQCQHRYGVSFQAPVAICDLTPELQHDNFQLVAGDAEPDMTLTPGPIMSLQTTSTVRCAGRCMQTQHCRSFTILKSEVAAPCQLYDFVTVDGLAQSPGRNYYEIWY